MDTWEHKRILQELFSQKNTPRVYSGWRTLRTMNKNVEMDFTMLVTALIKRWWSFPTKIHFSEYCISFPPGMSNNYSQLFSSSTGECIGMLSMSVCNLECKSYWLTIKKNGATQHPGQDPIVIGTITYCLGFHANTGNSGPHCPNTKAENIITYCMKTGTCNCLQKFSKIAETCRFQEAGQKMMTNKFATASCNLTMQ